LVGEAAAFAAARSGLAFRSLQSLGRGAFRRGAPAAAPLRAVRPGGLSRPTPCRRRRSARCACLRGGPDGPPRAAGIVFSARLPLAGPPASARFACVKGPSALPCPSRSAVEPARPAPATPSSLPPRWFHPLSTLLYTVLPAHNRGAASLCRAAHYRAPSQSGRPASGTPPNPPRFPPGLTCARDGIAHPAGKRGGGAPSMWLLVQPRRARGPLCSWGPRRRGKGGNPPNERKKSDATLLLLQRSKTATSLRLPSRPRCLIFVRPSTRKNRPTENKPIS